MTTSMSSDHVVKPLATAGFCYLIDQFILNEPNMNKSAIFAASSGAGAYAGMMLGSSLPDMSSTLPTFLGNGKGLLQRCAEIGSGVGISYGVNRYVLRNTSYRENDMNKIMALVGADILGEYASDYIAGRPLSILS